MNKSMQTPKFGDFLLNDGTFVSAPTDAKKVKGIYLYDGISLIDFSPKRKTYRKACHWCWEHGGNIASVKTLYFIIFHLEEINRIRESIGCEPLPFTLWSANAYSSTIAAPPIQSASVANLKKCPWVSKETSFRIPACPYTPGDFFYAFPR